MISDKVFFEKLTGTSGKLTVAGFGSLLSERSARSTFPNLEDFRVAKVGAHTALRASQYSRWLYLTTACALLRMKLGLPPQISGFRRVFAHTAAIFFERGIARSQTKEISSCSVEECEGLVIVVSLFEIKSTEEAIAAFIQREHEFRFIAAHPLSLDGQPLQCLAVLCGRWNDEDYKRHRCPPEEYQRRYGCYGIDCVWRNDVRPCRVYLRHCVLASKSLGPVAYDNFLDHSFLADRKTSVRMYLVLHPDIMDEEPPPHLAERYAG